MGSSIYYVITEGGGGLSHWRRLMTRGRGVVGHDDVIKKEFWKLNRQYTRVTPKPRILHYHQSCCSVIILICIYYCIIHGLFQFHAFCRQTFIDISDWYIWFYNSSRRFAKSRNWNWHIYWWCNIRGGGGGWELDDVWWRGGGGLKMVWKLMT